MSENVLNILYPFDNNYAPYAGISITSLLENNKEADEINIYIMGFGLDENNVKKLKDIVVEYGRSISFLDQNKTEQTIKALGMPSYRGASVAAARLFISFFIDESVERILYIDSDTLVVGSLLDLFRQDLYGNPVGMVIDSVARDYKKIVGFTKDEIYYNAGVILYDLKRWNELSCTDRITDHIKNVRNDYEALDQDLINLVLKGQITTIDLRYNFQPFHLKYKASKYEKAYGRRAYYRQEEIDDASNDVKILHCFRFLGMFPWHKDTMHPGESEFMKYKIISPWMDCKQIESEKSGIAFKVQNILYHIFPATLYLLTFRLSTWCIYRKNSKAILNKKGYRNI